MGMMDMIRSMLGFEELETRTSEDSFSSLIARAQGARSTPWRYATVREALGVPAINRCVTLISNTTGMLSMGTFQAGAPMDETQRPRLVIRPNPLTTPRVFYRDTAYYLATRGEAWWWIAKRDTDGAPLSLIQVHPREVTVEDDPNDLRFPKVTWRGRVMPKGDMRQLTLQPDDDNPLRGVGPLQVCGAAVSVSVEAQEWAANAFASGGYPSIVLSSETDLDQDEANDLKDRWIATPSNTPRVLTPGLKVERFPTDEHGAQMMLAREYQNGEAARMFGLPASLIDHSTPGSSLTYQNLEGEFGKFLTSCLRPNYLEPIEQEMTDLLTRATTARFNETPLRLADLKTRFEVYQLGIETGVLTAEYAQAREGIIAGDIESAPVPYAPPQAFPTSLQARTASEPVRCDGTRVFRDRIVPCNKLLAESGPFVGRCPRCKKEHGAIAV